MIPFGPIVVVAIVRALDLPWCSYFFQMFAYADNCGNSIKTRSCFRIVFKSKLCGFVKFNFIVYFRCVEKIKIYIRKFYLCVCMIHISRTAEKQRDFVLLVTIKYNNKKLHFRIDSSVERKGEKSKVGCSLPVCFGCWQFALLITTTTTRKKAVC